MEHYARVVVAMVIEAIGRPEPMWKHSYVNYHCWSNAEHIRQNSFGFINQIRENPATIFRGNQLRVQPYMQRAILLENNCDYVSEKRRELFGGRQLFNRVISINSWRMDSQWPKKLLMIDTAVYYRTNSLFAPTKFEYAWYKS